MVMLAGQPAENLLPNVGQVRTTAGCGGIACTDEVMRHRYRVADFRFERWRLVLVHTLTSTGEAVIELDRSSQGETNKASCAVQGSHRFVIMPAPQESETWCCRITSVAIGGPAVMPYDRLVAV
jgi:hypothetical protein